MKENEDSRAHAEPARGEPAEGSKTASTWLRVPWIVLGAAIFLLAGIVAYVGPVAILRQVTILLSEDTEYAPGFSERAFRKIQLGDTEATVRATLGAPLRIDDAKPYVSWLYGPAPAPEFEADGTYPDVRFSFTAIRFDENGTFDGAFGQISRRSGTSLLGASATVSIGDGANTLSLTKAEVEKLKAAKTTPGQIAARFGKPQASFESRVAKWLVYSRSPGSRNYRQRLIGTDRDGNVCRKVSEIYWD